MCTSKEVWLANTPWKRLWVPAKLDWEFAAGDQVSPSMENFLLATQALTLSPPAIQWKADEPGNASDKCGCSLDSSQHLRRTRWNASQLVRAAGWKAGWNHQEVSAESKAAPNRLYAEHAAQHNT